MKDQKESLNRLNQNRDNRSMLQDLIAKSTDLMNDASEDKALLADIQDFQEEQMRRKLNRRPDQYQQGKQLAEQRQRHHFNSHLREKFGWMVNGQRTGAERQNALRQMKQNIRVEQMVSAQHGHLTQLKRKSDAILAQSQYTRVGVHDLSSHREGIVHMKNKRANPRQQLN